MKAMLIGQDGALRWTDVPQPKPSSGQVLIEIHAAAVNRADLLQRKGSYPSPQGWPQWMGLEVAGVVAQIGENVTRWREGDQVCALLGGGGYAEYVAAPQELLMPMPRGLSFAEAATLPEAYATCYLNLFIEGGFHPGETLFFPAGASGLASVGIPMAKAFGAYVITSVLTGELKARIAHLGADRIIDASMEDTVQAVREEAENGHPVDVAIDCLSGETLGKCLPYVNEGCRWIVISTLDGVETTVPLRALLTRGITLKGSMLRKRSTKEKGEILRALTEKVWPKLESGDLRPTIGGILPIERAEEAHDLLQTGRNVGKVALIVRS